MKLPPFGSYLQSRLNSKAPIMNGITILIGDEHVYRRAKHLWTNGKPVLIYPMFEAASSFIWAVKGYEVDVFDYVKNGIPKKHVKSLALTLLDAGAVMVRYINSNGTFMKFIGTGHEHNGT